MASFDARNVDLLRRIHRLLFEQARSPFDIRRELSRDLRRLKIIAVTSGKGGVGKTTVSLNLAIAIAARGQRTLLLDADLGLGNVHVFAGIAPRGSMMDLVEGRQSAQNLLTPGPGNIQVLCGSSGSARLADLPPESIARLGHELAALGEAFDVMIIDTGAGISSQVTRFLAMADEIVVVTTPNIAATLDAYGVIKVMREEAMRGNVHLLREPGGRRAAVARRGGKNPRMLRPLFEVFPGDTGECDARQRGGGSKPDPQADPALRARAPARARSWRRSRM